MFIFKTETNSISTESGFHEFEEASAEYVMCILRGEETRENLYIYDTDQGGVNRPEVELKNDAWNVRFGRDIVSHYQNQITNVLHVHIEFHEAGGNRLAGGYGYDYSRSAEVLVNITGVKEHVKLRFTHTDTIPDWALDAAQKITTKNTSFQHPNAEWWEGEEKIIPVATAKKLQKMNAKEAYDANS